MIALRIGEKSGYRQTRKLPTSWTDWSFKWQIQSLKGLFPGQSPGRHRQGVTLLIREQQKQANRRENG